MNDCIFCKIINKDIPSTTVYEDDRIYAFKDINPVAPVHVLIVPKEHIDGADKITSEHSELIGYLWSKIPEIAKICGVLEDGFRVINNCGENGGQTVRHLHFHLIGGVSLGEKLI